MPWLFLGALVLALLVCAALCVAAVRLGGRSGR